MIIAYFITKESKKYKITASTGKITLSNDVSELLDCFMNDAADYRVTWSLYSILEMLQDLLPKEAYKDLIETDKLSWNGYRLFSSSSRVFSVNHPKHLHDNFYETNEVNIYHMAQFFPDYNPKDVNDVANKCQELVTALSEMGLNPTKLTSAVGIYDECILSHIELPTIYNMPNEALDACEYAHRVGIREWSAVYKIGHWNESWDIDCNGGYPSIMRDLPNTSKMKVWYAKKFEPCDFAILKGKVTITSDFSPIVDMNGVPYKGTKEDYITKDQWAMINVFKLGHFEMQDGWLMKFYTYEQPYFELMNDLYNARGESGLDRLIPKLISTGIYGRMAQEYSNRYGDYFNPILATMTTTRMSMKLGKMIISNNLQPNVISVTVDGALLDKKPDIQTGISLGEWRVSEQLKSLVISRGFQWHADKHPNNYFYDDMMKAINAKPHSNLYNEILLNNDLKTNRKFNKFPKNGKELLDNKYESEAISG
jgi:hypothetical protein